VALSDLNFRDLGGLPTTSGQPLARGILLRGEGPKNLDEDHRDELRALGVRSIFDLRSAGERAESPHDWQDANCTWHHFDMNNDLRAASITEWDRLRDNPDPAAGVLVMSQNYAAMPAALMRYWPEIADALLSGVTPAVINCTAGKDRTGVAVALLLNLLGVPREAILADYLKSAIFGENVAIKGSIERGFMESFGFVPSQPVIDALVGVRREFLDAALDQVDNRWGSIGAYFAKSGVDTARQQQLRDLFVAQSNDGKA
jgi:protein-tyrosine phosphatase